VLDIDGPDEEDDDVDDEEGKEDGPFIRNIFFTLLLLFDEKLVADDVPVKLNTVWCLLFNKCSLDELGVE